MMEEQSSIGKDCICHSFVKRVSLLHLDYHHNLFKQLFQITYIYKKEMNRWNETGGNGIKQ